MSRIRRTIAERISRSASTIPHVTLFESADVTEVEELRLRYKPKAEVEGGKLTITAIVLKVVAAALKAFPTVNASLDSASHEIVLKQYFHIAVAADTERGLVVPVVRDVDKKNIIELSVELVQLAEKARAGKLSLSELQGGNIAVTNLGGLGTGHFTPIINSPDVAILGVGRAEMQPVYGGSGLEPRLIAPLSLSFDHRALDGADGARFLHWIVEALNEPLLLALEG
jgi:pyruvate dehydrogenase E2 component (dihydrolipoamide acetyltransferase)